MFAARRSTSSSSWQASRLMYHADRLLKAAVERKFEIIGEALNRLARLSPETASRIREYEKIIAFRNLVIHGYDVVSDPIVWDVIQNKLSLLIEDVSSE